MENGSTPCEYPPLLVLVTSIFLFCFESLTFPNCLILVLLLTRVSFSLMWNTECRTLQFIFPLICLCHISDVFCFSFSIIWFHYLLLNMSMWGIGPIDKVKCRLFTCVILNKDLTLLPFGCCVLVRLGEARLSKS